MVPPLDTPLVAESESLRADDNPLWVRTVTLESGRAVAVKLVRGWGAYCAELGGSLDAARIAYRCATPQGGLVVSERGPRLRLNKNGTRDKYSVAGKLVGVSGAPAVPWDEDGLRAAMHGVLHGLAALHAAGVVHRDVRWANVALTSSGGYFLFDFETCAFAGEPPSCRLACWDEHTLERGAGGQLFTRASDIRLLGLLMRNGVQDNNIALSGAGRGFLQRLLAEDAALDARTEAARSAVALCRALGGGWKG